MRHRYAILLFFMTSALHAGDAGKSAFVTGLDHLSNEKWTDAATSFKQAVQADDENAIYHLNLGVALTMTLDAEGAKAAFLRAGKLDPKNPDVLVWSYARLQMFSSTAFGGAPPYKKTSYANQLCDQAIFYGSPRGGQAKTDAWKVIVKIAKQFAWSQLGKSDAKDATLDRIRELYRGGKYNECLAMIDKLRTAGAIDFQMLGYSAHCKVALGDVQGARDEYTAALREAPLTTAYLIGRARTEIALGSLRDADADWALARQIDANLTDKYYKDAEKLIADAKAKAPTETAAKLWADLKQAAAADVDPQKLAEMAGRLNVVRGGGRYITPEEYTREQTRLQILIAQSPADASRHLAMATFLLNPTVTRPVQLPNVNAVARIPCGKSNATRASAYLGEALKIDPKNIPAYEQMAIYCLIIGKPNDMIAWTKKAMEAGSNNVDLSKMFLDYHTALANNQASEAAALRTPRVSFQDRHEGNQIVTYRITTPPSAAELARADQLDAMAAQNRKIAPQPMQALIESLKQSIESPKKIAYQLASAHLLQWTGKYDQAIAAAQAGLKIDPYDLDILSYLIDICASTGQQSAAIEYQDLLNNMANPSSGRTLDQIWPQLKQTRFKGAKELLAQAELIDPGSPHIACANFAITQEQQNLADALVAGRILTAIEQARVSATGRSMADKDKTPLLGTDAIVCVYVHTALATMLNEKGQFDEVLTHTGQAIRLATRVNPSEFKVAIPETIKPQTPSEIGSDLGSLYATSNRLAANKLIAKKDYAQAANHVVILANLNPPDRQAMQIGYDIHRAVGFAPLEGKVPDGWKMMFEHWDRQRALDDQFGRTPADQANNAEIAAIDQEIDKINREIARGVGPDDLRELESRRDTLLAKRKQLQNTGPRRRGR